jgi:hypothetical protein
VVSFIPWLLYFWGKSPWYSLDRKLGGPWSQSGHSGEKKKSLPGTDFQMYVIKFDFFFFNFQPIPKIKFCVWYPTALK